MISTREIQNTLITVFSQNYKELQMFWNKGKQKKAFCYSLLKILIR